MVARIRLCLYSNAQKKPETSVLDDNQHRRAPAAASSLAGLIAAEVGILDLDQHGEAVVVIAIGHRRAEGSEHVVGGAPRHTDDRRETQRAETALVGAGQV
mgnify:CR=1 FL=1